MLHSVLSSEPETAQLVEQLCQHFLSEDFAKGFEKVKAYWFLPEQEIEQLERQVMAQWPLVQSRFGASVGMEMVRKERIGQSFVRYFYLHKFAHHALYWRISFYQSEHVWQINGVSFDDDISCLFEPVAL